MSEKGFRGISYPFRVSPKGGVVMSTTSANNFQHIDESIEQILNTNYKERPMEKAIYSTISEVLFEPMDESLEALILSDIEETLENLEERVSLDMDNTEFYTEEQEDGSEILYLKLTYRVLKYNTEHTMNYKVGEI